MEENNVVTEEDYPRGLREWLMPQETVVYAAAEPVEYGEAKLRFFLTGERMILHARKGFVFKKEAVVSEKLKDITTMAYREEGVLFSKKGVLQLQLRDKVMELRGASEVIKAIWQQLQQRI